MSKYFDTLNINKLIIKLLQTSISGTIMSFVANYTKGRKAYTPSRYLTPIKRLFNTSVPQCGVSNPHNLTFTLQTYHQPEHRIRSCLTQMISPSHLHIHECSQEIHTAISTYSLPGQNITVSH